MKTSSVLSPHRPETTVVPVADFRADLVAGLRARPRRIPSKYFYDARGSRLFEEICAQEEYFPTRTEVTLLREHADEIGALLGPALRVVELGSGSSLKSRLLLRALTEPRSYVPVEISSAALRALARELAAAFPAVRIRPLEVDFTGPFRLPPAVEGVARTVFFFPGSTIGNFEREEAARFLARLARLGGAGSGLLIGLGLQTDEAVLERAYNDRAGVTAAFNLNLLHRARREAGARLDPEGFRHEAIYDTVAARIEMRLVSRWAQAITIDGEAFPFAPGDAILTEYSHKFTLGGFAALARRAGWKVLREWTDPDERFAVVHAAVPGEPPEGIDDGVS
jgi:L-histidine Nalpha-methyltransferase